MDPCKALNNYVSALYGKHSVKLTSEEDRHASICLLANNHPSEQLFGTFTEAFVTGGRIDHHKAVRAGQSRYNGDFFWDTFTFKNIVESTGVDRLIHHFSMKLQDSLVVNVVGFIQEENEKSAFVDIKWTENISKGERENVTLVKLMKHMLRQCKHVGSVWREDLDDEIMEIY